MTSTSAPTVKPKAAAAIAWLNGIGAVKEEQRARNDRQQEHTRTDHVAGKAIEKNPVPSRPMMEKIPTSEAILLRPTDLRLCPSGSVRSAR